MGISDDLIIEAIGCARAPMSLTSSDDEDSKSVDVPVEGGEESITELLSLNAALMQLEPEDRQIVKLRFIDNKTQADTAAALGTTQVQISRRERKLIVQLRRLMCE